MKNTVILLSTILAGVLAVAGCKKGSEQAQTIELPEGQLHVSTQWVEGNLWVESLDPKSRICTFSQYRDGKPVESGAVILKNCRIGGLGSSMMRPMMERGMMRPDMPPRPGRARPGMVQPPAGQLPQTQQPIPAPAPVAPPAQG